ncbi:hypothetical protein C4552_04425 [Candidatus Parcubacteria bacterium]|nr:MAG: hypothetical protein C4552_04425 [Candidatus Parcubacteria bacterium]
MILRAFTLALVLVLGIAVQVWAASGGPVTVATDSALAERQYDPLCDPQNPAYGSYGGLDALTVCLQSRLGKMALAFDNEHNAYQALQRDYVELRQRHNARVDEIADLQKVNQELGQKAEAVLKENRELTDRVTTLGRDKDFLEQDRTALQAMAAGKDRWLTGLWTAVLVAFGLLVAAVAIVQEGYRRSRRTGRELIAERQLNQDLAAENQGLKRANRELQKEHQRTMGDSERPAVVVPVAGESQPGSAPRSSAEERHRAEYKGSVYDFRDDGVYTWPHGDSSKIYKLQLWCPGYKNASSSHDRHGPTEVLPRNMRRHLLEHSGLNGTHPAPPAAPATA